MDRICINDVPSQFRKIPSKVRASRFSGSTKKYLGANNSKIPLPDYTSNIKNWLGREEHIQGIQRIGKYLIISGGLKGKFHRSQLIVLKMETCPENGPWALPEYGYLYKKPHKNDKIIDVYDIDSERWHPGGIQALNNIVAIPIYGDNQGSEIRFFEFQESEYGLTEIENLRLERNHCRSKAVALTSLPDDHFMLMVWDDENLDFHYSNSADIYEGFNNDNICVNKTELSEGFDPKGFMPGTYQSINFIRDSNDTIYFVAMRNSNKISPTIPGKNYADLYKVTWLQGFSKPPKISIVEHKRFYCYNQQCNFGAGAGIYIDDEDHLFLYGASHWLHSRNKRYNFNEYSY